MSNYEATRYTFSGANLSGVQGVNTGIIVPWSSASIPSGFLECNGAAVSRSTYSALFAIISTTYGVGDGASTFNLPNLSDNVIVSKSNNKNPDGTEAEDHGIIVAVGIPSISVRFAPLKSYLVAS